MHPVAGFARRCVVIAIAVAQCASPQMFQNPGRIGPEKFPIMAWGQAPSELDRLREMHDAGLNIAGFCRPKDIEAVRTAGLSCFVTDPRIAGNDWKNLPPDSVIRPKVAALIQQTSANPAVLGYYLIDEPSGLILPALGRVARMVKELAPGKLPYINLFPTIVARDRIGMDYEDYVRMLAADVKQPFLSYDNYALFDGEVRDQFYDNLEVVRRIAMEHKIPFWNCILANAHFNYMEPSDATLHFQVYATLAYGGRGIQYFTYYTPAQGNYRLAALDQFGNRTDTWDALRRINLELHALAPVMLQLRSTGVYHSAGAAPQYKTMADSKLVGQVKTWRQEKDRFLLGEFEDASGRPYLMLVNKDLSRSIRFSVELKDAGRKLIRVNNYSGKEERFGGEMDWLAPGGGILLRIE